MGIGGPPESGFYTGGGLSAEVPHLYPVALDGRPYLLDMKAADMAHSTRSFYRQSIQLLRDQSDASNLPGEQSISPEELWRRGMDDWSHGAGQVHYDRAQSDPARFRQSKGVYVWERWEVSLLPDTGQKRSSANTNLNLAVAGTRLYLVDGTALVYTPDLTAFTTVTGTPGVAAVAIATDGYTVWTAHTASGIYSTNRTLGAASQYTTGNCTLVAYLKGRLMAAYQNILYNVITSGGALPTPLYTHPNVDFAWTCFAEGQGGIYCGGFSGDKSLVYRTTVRTDGTALDIPILVGELPDGEILRSMQGYLGFLVLGTDKGVRFATTDAQGNLTLGSLINIGQRVNCFEPQDRFCWFGWSNYDAGSSGLGRLDLSVFTNPLTPAYASDLMATAQGAVLSVVTFLNQRVFAVSGAGFYAEVANKVASGTLESGRITYGMPDDKIAFFVSARTRPLVGTIRLGLGVDGGSYVDLGSGSVAAVTLTTLQANQVRGEVFEILTTLQRSAALTTGPTLTRQTLRVNPGPKRGDIFNLPLLFHEVLEIDGQERFFNIKDNLDFVIGLMRDHKMVTYQEMNSQFVVIVEDYQWMPESEILDGTFWNGTCVLKLKSITSE